MAPLHFVIRGLAHVMEQAATPGQSAIEANLIGHEAAQGVIPDLNWHSSGRAEAVQELLTLARQLAK